MNTATLLLALLLAIAASAIAVGAVGWRRPAKYSEEGPALSALYFFLILFLATWVSAWLAPWDPYGTGVPWLTLLGTALIVTPLVLILTPRTRRQLRSADASAVVAGLLGVSALLGVILIVALIWGIVGVE